MSTKNLFLGGMGWTYIIYQQFLHVHLRKKNHGWCHARDGLGQRMAFDGFCTRKKWVVQGWTAWDSLVFIFFFGWKCEKFAPKEMYPCRYHWFFVQFPSLMDFNGGLGSLDRNDSKHKKMVAVEDWRWPTLVHCCQNAWKTLLDMSWHQGVA